jgi:MATE family multidrug resistance protein
MRELDRQDGGRTTGRELVALVRLAGPVVAAEIGWVMMWLVDSMLVGRLGAEALAAVGLGGHIYFAVGIVGLGMLLGLDYVVAHAFGAGDLGRAHRALVHGMYLALALSVVLTPALLVGAPLLSMLGIDEKVLTLAIPYLEASAWSLGPLLLFTALRRYLQALGIVVPIMVTLLTANIVNALAAWALIYGRLGAPALGVTGAGWATCFSRVYMFLGLLAYTIWYERRRTGAGAPISLRFDPALTRTLVRLGTPAALQLTLEIGSITVVSMLAALLAPVALASHHVALSVASFTFMVPLGLSSAAAVVVGHALGRGDPHAARRAGWMALALGTGFMATAAATLVAVAPSIVRLFTSDPAVVTTGVALLMVAALFQLSDGVQVVTTGALRGTGDTRTPMVANLVGHWILSLPLGSSLCFALGYGVVGLWFGLAAGLSAVAGGLLFVWWRRSNALVAATGSGRDVRAHVRPAAAPTSLHVA